LKFQRQITVRILIFSITFVFFGAIYSRALETNVVENVQAEHDALGNTTAAKISHTTNPDAQWYPDAGLGLFIHWGIASVKGINISWSMRDGLNGKPAQITPNDYFAMAKDFNPTNYNPDKWLKAAKDAGFVYAVLTTRHHEGFALWPSDYGDFSTKNYMGGRDLVKDYVEACRKNGLKVGLYYSPPDWNFDRDFLNFSMRKDSPPLGPDLKPRTEKKSPKEIAEHTKAYAALVRGQLEELLTHYGKIDLLWFDGEIPGASGDEVMPISQIRQLQPGIVVNGRFHGHGDFINFERTLTATKPADGWAEYCNTWSDYWPYVIGAKFRANGFIIGQYVTCRSLHINYLLDVGPMSDGELPAQVYMNFAVLGDWMKTNGKSVKGISPLPDDESANIPATSSGTVRYLFALPKFQNNGANRHVYPDDLLSPEDATLTLSGISKPVFIKLLRDNSPLDFSYTNQTVTVQLPAAKRTQLVDVAQIELKQ
jgi:alpha-L-fucosidase